MEETGTDKVQLLVRVNKLIVAEFHSSQSAPKLLRGWGGGCALHVQPVLRIHSTASSFTPAGQTDCSAHRPQDNLVNMLKRASLLYLIALRVGKASMSVCIQVT